jgi:hypothetical protein
VLKSSALFAPLRASPAKNVGLSTLYSQRRLFTLSLSHHQHLLYRHLRDVKRRGTSFLHFLQLPEAHSQPLCRHYVQQAVQPPPCGCVVFLARITKIATSQRRRWPRLAWKTSRADDIFFTSWPFVNRFIFLSHFRSVCCSAALFSPGAVDRVLGPFANLAVRSAYIGPLARARAEG